MIETISVILFILAILFVALAAPKPADKKKKDDLVPQQPAKPADHSSSPPKSPDDTG
ncbi:MAG: hypothetical protein ACLQAR_03895 [Steroidobacteraceae bacterium]